jgi:hypothetical protein
MNGNQYYDERQLIERGKIMQQSFILLIILEFVNAVLYGECNIIWADIFDSQLLIITIAGCYCTIRMILKDAYNNIGSRLHIGLIISGITGLIVIWSNTMQMIRGRTGFVLDGKLTSNGAMIIIFSGMLLNCIVHLIKVYKDKKADLTEDE